MGSPAPRSSLDSNATSRDNIPNRIAFRVQLLQFVTAYHACRSRDKPARLTNLSLIALRLDNVKRAKLWIRQRKDQEIASPEHDPEGLLEQDYPGLQESPCLLDIVPMFIALTAARMRLGSRIARDDHDGSEMSDSDDDDSRDEWLISEMWLDLAAELMFQAAEETGYRDGSSIAVDVAFAWGPLSGSSSSEQDALHLDLRTLDTVFRGLESAWYSVRHEYEEEARYRHQAVQIFDKYGRTVESEQDPNFEDIRFAHQVDHDSERYPLDDFFTRLDEFLWALSSSIAPPLLSQLDDGDEDDDLVLEDIDLTSAESKRLRAIARGFYS